MSLFAIIAFILALIAIVALIVLYVIYFTKKTPTNLVTYTVVQGSATSPTFVGSGNTVYIVPTTFSGTITVTKPSSNVTNTVFTVSNVANTQDVVLVASTGISVTNGNIPAGTGAQFLWLSSTAIQRIT
jgi:hypothetical protein